MQVADRWQAPLALTAISSVLCKVQPGFFPTAEVYALPLVLQASPAFAKVAEYAVTSLLSVFGDAAATASNVGLVQKLVLLPQRAMLALLQSDSLLADAETTVLLLLSEWCVGEQGKACTTMELQQLNECIRYSRVAAPYLTQLSETLHTPPLTLEQRMELLYFWSLPKAAQSNFVTMENMEHPSGWYKLERPSTVDAASRDMCMTLRVSEINLHCLIRELKVRMQGGLPAAHYSSPRVLARGFWWALKLWGSRKGQVWCTIVVHAVSSLLTHHQGSDVKHGIFCDAQIDLKSRAGVADMCIMSCTCFPVGSDGVGGTIDAEDGDVLGPLDVQWWTDYLVDGFLTFNARVTNIGC